MSHVTAMVAALLVGGLIALPTEAAPPKKVSAKQAGVLHVYDGGSLFTTSAIDKAKAAMGKTMSEHTVTLTIDTHPTIPMDRKAPAKGEETKFFEQWAKDQAAGEKAKGVYVLVCRSPGYAVVISDKATRDRGFTNANEQKLRDMLINSFKEAAKETDDKKRFEIRDKALSAAADYVTTVLKSTVK